VGVYVDPIAKEGLWPTRKLEAGHDFVLRLRTMFRQPGEQTNALARVAVPAEQAHPADYQPTVV